MNILWGDEPDVETVLSKWNDMQDVQNELSDYSGVFESIYGSGFSYGEGGYIERKLLI